MYDFSLAGAIVRLLCFKLNKGHENNFRFLL